MYQVRVHKIGPPGRITSVVTGPCVNCSASGLADLSTVAYSTYC